MPQTGTKRNLLSIQRGIGFIGNSDASTAISSFIHPDWPEISGKTEVSALCGFFRDFGLLCMRQKGFLHFPGDIFIAVSGGSKEVADFSRNFSRGSIFFSYEFYMITGSRKYYINGNTLIADAIFYILHYPSKDVMSFCVEKLVLLLFFNTKDVSISDSFSMRNMIYIQGKKMELFIHKQ